MSLRLRAALAAALATSACKAPHFELADLPEAPIAIVYRTVGESERVLEAAEQRSKPGDGRDGNLQIRLERIQQLAGLRSATDLEQDLLGRLGFYVAPSGSLEIADFVRRGARPLEWSPDHARLLVSAPGSADRLQLFEWNAASGELRQLTRDAAHIDGCYGPDGALAFVRLERNHPKALSRVWIQRPGEAPRPVTAGPEDVQPAWSPDGARLVFAAGAADREALHWVDPVTGAGGSLGRGRAPVWTPDGAWIVYSAPTPKGWKLWRMRPDGSGKRGFGKSAFHEGHPAVSPDGRFVAFMGTKNELSPISRLLVRPFDGSMDRQLGLSGSALAPVW